MSLEEKISEFEKTAEYKKEVDETLRKLNEFRMKYPFNKNPEKIDHLTGDDLFLITSSQVGDFFKWIEYELKKLGHIYVFSKVYRNAVNQLEDFRLLLLIAIDKKKSLAEKVDAPWEKISGMGGDKHVAKKIITCFNDNVLPIFKTEDLEYFFDKIIGKEKLPLNYDNYSVGQKYQLLTEELIKFKEVSYEIKDWENLYFSKFLYTMYPPPRMPKLGDKSWESKPLSDLGLLFEPRYHDEVVFLFSKLHEKLGFPYIIEIHTDYPDIIALDSDRKEKSIEIETYASQFKDHDPKGCDFIVCWENDLENPPEDWPSIIQLKDYL